MPTPARLNKIKKVLSHRQPDLTLVLENIHDPHNVSAILRSADAVGVLEICLVYNDEVFPKLGRQSSASAKKWLLYQKFKTIDQCYSYLRDRKFKIYATHLDNQAKSLYQIDLTKKVALVLGNEHRGVSKEALEKADGNLQIPQYGMVQSLNVSVAAAVILFEALRQREKAGYYQEQRLNSKTHKEVLSQWTKKKDIKDSKDVKEL